MLTNIQYRILKRISPAGRDTLCGFASEPKAKLAVQMGTTFFDKIAGKVLIDFGCGGGAGAVEMAKNGAKRVIGIDIRENVLQEARQKALVAGVHSICDFASSTSELADIIVSVDAFEHFADPAGVLCLMNSLLRPSGELLVSFGPTWYHPFGGHLFSIFPWAHLIFDEKALVRWRSAFKADGATRFSEVAGGLNQMTISKFEKLVANSPFEVLSIELVPIKNLRRFHNRLTREFTTSVVRCRLVKRKRMDTCQSRSITGERD